MANTTDINKKSGSSGLSWARLVSNILSPPIVWAILAFPIAFRYAESPAQALMWGFVYVMLVCLLPLGFVGLLVWKGKIGDMHMENRRDRVLPFFMSLLLTTIAWWVLRFMGAPAVFPMLALFSLVQIAIIALITVVWQISMHAMSITGATIATALVFGVTAGLLTIPLIVLVGAARLKLKRHTPAQVLAGTLVGALVPTLILLSVV